MPVEITTAQLAQLAKRPDIELRVEGQGDQAQLRDDREGWWVGRLARNLKIKFGEEGGRAPKQLQYQEATNAVRAALVRDYGEEIGEKAFRAGKGHQVGEDWDYSKNHPITGRHIAKMIKAAETELKRDDPYRVVEFDRGGFRDTAGQRITAAPVRLWFRDSVDRGRSPNSDEWRNARQREDFREELDHLQYRDQSGARGFERMRFVVAPELVGGGEDQPVEWSPGLSHGDFIAGKLLRDAEGRSEERGAFAEFTGGAIDRTIRAEELAPNKRAVLDDLHNPGILTVRPGAPPLNSQFILDLPRQTMIVENSDGDVARTGRYRSSGDHELIVPAGADRVHCNDRRVSWLAPRRAPRSVHPDGAEGRG